MSNTAVAGIGFVAMLGLIALRMPVALAMIVVGGAGYTYFAGLTTFFSYMKSTPYHLFSNYTLSVIPLFILMGSFAERSGLSTQLFRAASGFVGHRRGGLGIALVAACTGFGAICGSAVATTATFARAALPELRKAGYDQGFAAATIAAGGTLGILIPPSVILVIYAILAQQNIAKLFLAALIPGLMASISYCIVIWIVTRLRPEKAPVAAVMPWPERMKALRAVWPVLVVAVAVLGGIYGGFVTTTEGAAVGAAAMMLICLVQRTIRWRDLAECLLQTAETTAMIFLILLGAEIFNGFLSLSQLPENAAAAVASWTLPPYAVLAILLVIYVILGGLMDEIAMILLTLPVFLPIVLALDLGLPSGEVGIWFGILILMLCGVGLLAPPIGLGVFVVSAIAREIPVSAIYKGVLPFLAADIIRIALVASCPVLALGLVRLLQ
jgi:tripartite ATP-independent transporter DctM subunit